MSVAKKCDRCGAFYDAELSYPLIQVDGRTRQLSTIGNSATDFDLCQKCVNSLEKWWKDKK